MFGLGLRWIKHNEQITFFHPLRIPYDNLFDDPALQMLDLLAIGLNRHLSSCNHRAVQTGGCRPDTKSPDTDQKDNRAKQKDSEIAG